MTDLTIPLLLVFNNVVLICYWKTRPATPILCNIKLLKWLLVANEGSIQCYVIDGRENSISIQCGQCVLCNVKKAVMTNYDRGVCIIIRK